MHGDVSVQHRVIKLTFDPKKSFFNDFGVTSMSRTTMNVGNGWADDMNLGMAT